VVVLITEFAAVPVTVNKLTAVEVIIPVFEITRLLTVRASVKVPVVPVWFNVNYPIEAGKLLPVERALGANVIFTFEAYVLVPLT